MGQRVSSTKVLAHLKVVGQCGGVDRLTLSVPRRKGGRRLLAAFTFPSAASGGADHHRSVQRARVPVGSLMKKDSATPVRVDFLAGESLVAHFEMPLSELLAGLKANATGRVSSLFFTLEQCQANNQVTTYFSRHLLGSAWQSRGDNANLTRETAVTKAVAEGDAAIIIPEVTYRNLVPEVKVFDLVDGQKWVLVQPEASMQEANHQPKMEEAGQDGENKASMTQEATPFDLGDGQRWSTPQAELRHRRGEPRGAPSMKGRDNLLSQPSPTLRPEQSQTARRAGRERGCVCVPCLVDCVLQCAQALSFTMLTYHLFLQWFA